MWSCSSIAFIFGRSRRIVPTPSSTCRVTNSDSATRDSSWAVDDAVAATLTRTGARHRARSAQTVEDGDAQQALDVPRSEAAEADSVRCGHDEPRHRGQDPLGRDVDPEVPGL